MERASAQFGRGRFFDIPLGIDASVDSFSQVMQLIQLKKRRSSLPERRRQFALTSKISHHVKDEAKYDGEIAQLMRLQDGAFRPSAKHVSEIGERQGRKWIGRLAKRHHLGRLA